MKTTYSTDPRAFPLIEAEALRLASYPSTKRIAVKKIMEDIRAKGYLVNNSDSAKIARDLIENFPALEPLIETRALGNRGKNVLGASEHNDVLLLARILRNRKLSIKSVTFEYQGNERTADLGFLRMLVKEAA